MHYRLRLESPETSLVEELRSNKEEVQHKAFELLEDHGKKGRVIIERKHSPYYGDYKHYMTCSFSESVVA